MATRAQILADSYVNGNRKDVRDAIAELPTLEAVAMAFAIAADLRRTRGKAEYLAFLDSVDAWGEA